MKNNFTVLFDYDSMIYKAVHHIVNITIIRRWFDEGKSRKWMETEIVNLTINRLSNMSDAIFLMIEDTGINIDSIEYFLTDCPRSVRKAASPEYKANRKRNKWVGMIRKELLKMEFAKIDPQWEADDLIKDRAVQLGVDHYVICTIDKDLQQIPGIHFNYYRPALKDENGKYIIIDGFKQYGAPKGLEIVSVKEAERFFWLQMLMGDSVAMESRVFLELEK